jgi:hypothetical protein
MDKEDDEPEDKSGAGQFQDTSKTINVIFGGESGFASKRAQKLALCEILSIKLAVPRPLQWSEVPISFSRDDQWTSFFELGNFPLCWIYWWPMSGSPEYLSTEGVASKEPVGSPWISSYRI